MLQVKHAKLSDIINDIIEDMPIIGIDFNVKKYKKKVYKKI
jgi:hypothetical protein